MESTATAIILKNMVSADLTYLDVLKEGWGKLQS